VGGLTVEGARVEILRLQVERQAIRANGGLPAALALNRLAIVHAQMDLNEALCARYLRGRNG
jgi:hypothetical protein